MKIKIKRILCVVLCLCMTLTAFCIKPVKVSADNKSQLQQEINDLKAEADKIQKEIDRLKAEKSDQAAILAEINKKIDLTQQQIIRCNEEIEKINDQIEANKLLIKEKEDEIAADKLAFKKRLSAMYMSNSGSTIQILLGADDFSEFLSLSQFTSSMTAKDKKIIENLEAEIVELNKIIAQNETLLNDQLSIKEEISKQQKELEAQQSEANAIYNQISKEQSNQQGELNDVNAEVKKLQKKLEDEIANQKYQSFVNSNTGFRWPVDGFFTISAHYKSNDAVHKGRHNGMDIAGSGISGQPIRAAADGIVTTVYNRCSHNYKKSGNCCGNGYGNYAVINHGTMKINGNSASYVAYYAHATKIVVKVGQKVKQGDVIGYVGTTGWSTGYHLHFGVLKNGAWINPYNLYY